MTDCTARCLKSTHFPDGDLDRVNEYSCNVSINVYDADVDHAFDKLYDISSYSVRAKPVVNGHRSNYFINTGASLQGFNYFFPGIIQTNPDVVFGIEKEVPTLPITEVSQFRWQDESRVEEIRLGQRTFIPHIFDVDT